MRLWHYELLPHLPDKQVLSQWRECCSIAKVINDNGTPNHMLVNKVLEYPAEYFRTYCRMVCTELEDRGWTIGPTVYERLMDRIDEAEQKGYFDESNKTELIFENWHNERYLYQCFYNLQEKYDCGGIPERQWNDLNDYMMKRETENE